MLCEKILGKLKDFDLTGKTVEYVDIEWHEAFKKIHRKTTDSGREVGIRLDDSVLTRGLFQDDVIYADEKLVIAVNTPPCEVIVYLWSQDTKNMWQKSAMRSETAMHRFSGEIRKIHLLPSTTSR